MLEREIDPSVTYIPFRGLDTSQNDLSIEHGRSPDMLNVEIDTGGTIKKRAGHALMAHQPGGEGSTMGLALLRQESQFMFYLLTLKGQRLWIMDGLTGEWSEEDEFTGAGGVISGAQAYHTDGSETLYLTNGVDEVRLFPGGVGTEDWPQGVESDTPGEQVRGYPAWWEEPDGPESPADWPRRFTLSSTGGAGAGDTSARLLAYGFARDPNRIDFSELGVPWNFLPSDLLDPENEAKEYGVTDGGWFYCFRGDGDRIMWAGQFAGMLVVMKRRRTFIYSGAVGASPDQGGLSLVHVIDIGTVAPESVTAAGNDLYFWSEDGPKRLSKVMESGDIRSDGFEGRVYRKVREARYGSDSVVARHNQRLQRIEFYYPGSGSNTNNLALIYYYNLDEWAAFDGDLCEIVGAAVFTDPSGNMRFIGARHDGQVTDMHLGSGDGGKDISAYYATKWYIFPSMADRARVVYVDLVIGSEGLGDSTLMVGVDYETVFETMELGIKAHGSVFDGTWGAPWGADENGVVDPNIEGPLRWGAGTQSIMRYAGGNSGHLYRFKVADEGGSAFSFGGIFPVVTAKGKV